MEENFKFGKYKHFKGNYYQALYLAKDSETLNTLVVYKALYGNGEIWVRDLRNFLEEVTVNGETIKRFTYIEE